ncbi:hypothetical protein [Streptacidiphilus carbonis]|uniref:hypothetical protein n=1 Tax=Streptacidiphilus carbonis TaxID=105422 RepID=UPI00069355A9|nr:hypothetical protein [Streptacidiphilus carbonis]
MIDGSTGLRRFAPRVGVAAAVLLLAGACSSSGGGTASPGASVTTGAATGAATTAAAPSASAAGSSSAAASGAAGACAPTTTPAVSGSGPADTASAGAQVAGAYQKFFDPATPSATKVGLLQNGTAFVPVMTGFASNPLAAQAAVSVQKVAFTSATAADVTFNLCESGQPVLPNSTGKAVQEGGVWKVADATLCGLVKLNSGGAAVPGCS